MTDPRKSDPQRFDDARLDNLLADFTDRVLQSTGTGRPVLTWDEQDSEDAELLCLQRTVLQLHAAIDPSRPDPAMQRRIQQRLKQEWSRRPPARQPILGRLGRLFTPAGRPVLAYSLACLLVLLLAAVLVLLPPGSTPLTGAAGQENGSWAILAAGVLVAAAGLFYLLRRRH